MLEFDNVCFQYDVDDYAIMDKLSFQIQDGEFVCRSCACEWPAN